MLKKIFEKGKRILIAGVLCMGALLAASKDAAPVKAAEPDGPVIRLEDAEVYGAVIHQSVVTVPIVVEGTVDMHLYDLKVTYDPAVLQPLQEEILVGNWNGIGETAADSGQLHLAGVSLEESARTASGTVGRLSFAPNRVITTDGFATSLDIQAVELGEDTPEASVKTQGARVVLNASDGPYDYGDVNKDKQLTVGDALAVLKCCVQLPTDPQKEFDREDPLALALADHNGNGIGVEDAIYILKVCVRLEQKIPYRSLGKETEAAEKSFAAGKSANVPGQTQTSDGGLLLDKGDLIPDESYTAKDAYEAYRIAEKRYDPDDAVLERADVNSDQAVTETDVRLLLRAVLGEYHNFGYQKPEGRIIYVDSKTFPIEGICYRTLGEALKVVHAQPPGEEAERITLLFAPGTYREYTQLGAPYVTYEALDPSQDLPNLTFYYGCERYYHSLDEDRASADHASTVITSEAHDFIARNMMFENSYNIYVTQEEKTDYTEDNTNPHPWDREATIRESKYQTQGLALRVDADRSSFYNCRIIGRQDTLLMNNYNRVYYENCYIEGTVDFIYGNGTAVFESCTVNSPYNAGHITAASTQKDQPYGFLLKDCTLTRQATTPSSPPKDQSYSLGRPWNQPAMVVYCRCKMDGHISNKNTKDFDRFVQMGNNGFLPEEARFGEYGTMDMEGNLIDLKEVAPDYEKLITDEEMQGFYRPFMWLKAKYDPNTHQMKEDGWNPGGYPSQQA